MLAERPSDNWSWNNGAILMKTEQLDFDDLLLNARQGVGKVRRRAAFLDVSIWVGAIGPAETFFGGSIASSSCSTSSLPRSENRPKRSWRAFASCSFSTRSPARGSWLGFRLRSAPPLSRKHLALREDHRMRARQIAGKPSQQAVGTMFGSSRHNQTSADSTRKVAAELHGESIRSSHPAAVGRQVFCGARQSIPDRR